MTHSAYQIRYNIIHKNAVTQTRRGSLAFPKRLWHGPTQHPWETFLKLINFL